MTDFANVHRDEAPIMFMRAREDEADGIQRAWAAFETAVGLKGRKFFGTYNSETHEYRVCTELKPDDDPKALACEVGTLPGGAYLRARLQGEPPGIYDKIPTTFDEMVKGAAVDPSRPSIEFYRSRDVIDLFLPVK